MVERLLGGVAGCRCAGGEGEALVPSARGGGERVAGRRLRTTARGPRTRAALHALFGSFTSRAYLLVGLQQSDSPKSKSGFPLRRRFARSHGKLEDCAAHQAARSAAWRGAASRSLRKLDEAHIACTHRGGLAGTSTLYLLNGGLRSQGQALGHRPVERCTRYTIRSSSCLIRHHPAAVLERARGTVRSPAREIRETTRDGANHADAHGTHLTG